MAAVVHLIPAAAGVEHRCGVAGAKVIDQVRTPGAVDRVGQQVASIGGICDGLSSGARHRHADNQGSTAGPQPAQAGSWRQHDGPFGADVDATCTASATWATLSTLITNECRLSRVRITFARLNF